MMKMKQSTVNGQQSTLKILILTHRFNPDVGGIETNSEILATAFAKYGAEVHVLTWTKYKGNQTFPFIVIRDPDLKILFKEHRWADVVFENNPCLRLSWINMVIRKPLVIALNTWVNRIKGNKGIRDKLKNLWFRRANAVIAVSEAIRKREWLAAIVIENPYNNNLFKMLPDAQKTKPFIFLGRLVSDKGADQAIKAISMLAEKNVIDANRLQLTITGDGPEMKNLLRLREQSGLYGAIHFTGILKGEELVDCLNQHQYMIVPSVWEEPYGNVVLEGMACGCVPVASDGGGLSEAVGNAGFIFKRNDTVALVDTLEHAIADPLDMALKQANAPAHLANHTVNLVAGKYFEIIKKAAGKK